MWKLFLDDERMPPGETADWVICRCIDDVIREITTRGTLPNHISFDHDLGEPWLLRGDGMKVARYICDIDLYTAIRFPTDFTWFVHSQNPVGRDNINGFMTSYMKFRPSDTKAQAERLAIIEATQKLHEEFDKLLKNHVPRKVRN